MGVSLRYSTGGNGGFRGFGGNGDADAVVFGQQEEGLDGDSMAFCVEAGGVLFVAFGLVIVWIEAAEAVVVGAASLSQGVSESKAEVSPRGVAGSDVFTCTLNTAGDGFNIGLNAGSGKCLGLDFRFIIGLCEPFAGIEGFVIHGGEGVQG